MQTYQLSSEKPILGILLTLVTSLLSCAILSFLYSLLIYYIPFIYVLFILTLGFGFVLGFLIALGAQYGHVRDAKFVALCGIVFGIVGVYASWAVWLSYSGSALIWHPLDIIEIIPEIAYEGVWKIGSFKPTGILLYGVWGLEALMIVVTSWLGAMGTYADAAYCEHCRAWIKLDDTYKIDLENIDTHHERHKIEKLDFESLKKLKKYQKSNASDAVPPPMTQLNLKKCSSCANLCLMDITEITFSVQKQGSSSEIESSDNSIITNAVISNSRYSDLKSNWTA